MSTWRPAEDGFFNPYDSGPARPPISTAESAGGPQASRPGGSGKYGAAPYCYAQ